MKTASQISLKLLPVILLALLPSISFAAHDYADGTYTCVYEGQGALNVVIKTMKLNGDIDVPYMEVTRGQTSLRGFATIRHGTSPSTENLSLTGGSLTMGLEFESGQVSASCTKMN